MRILVFGKNGQVARMLQEEASADDELIPLSREDVDLMQPGMGAAAINRYAPQIAINASAYTAVDQAEKDQASAQRLNTDAPAELAKAALEAGANFIHLSTDYVFDGTNTGTYNEGDLVNPLNVYGATKLAGEKAVLEANENAIIIRTSWVFSEVGANFVKTMLRLAETREELNIVSDQVGGPTAARDIAKAVLIIAASKSNGAMGAGLYHYQGAPVTSWAGFAEDIFKTAQKDMTVQPIPTAEYPTPARRPLRTVLDCGRIEKDFGIQQPDWRAALERVITALQ